MTAERRFFVASLSSGSGRPAQSWFLVRFFKALGDVAVGLAARLGPEAVQAQMRRIEALAGFITAFGLVPVLKAEGRLPAQCKHMRRSRRAGRRSGGCGAG